MTELNNSSKPNIYRTQASEITPGGDAMVPPAADARFLQRAHAIRTLLGKGDGSAKRFLFLVTLTFDL